MEGENAIRYFRNESVFLDEGGMWRVELFCEFLKISILDQLEEGGY